MSYFSQPKNEARHEPNKKTTGATVDQAKPADAAVAGPASTLGPGMLVTGNIVCAGSMQILGRVVGDIHAAQLTISEGARVEGNVTAQETVISGSFKGTIHGHSVKLQSTAVVEGEIYKNSLMIDENAQFEGTARRLERPVEPPSSAQIHGDISIVPPVAGSTADVVPMPQAS